MAGRKTKLTPKLIVDAAKLIKVGNYVVAVCEYLGIDESTWYRWMRDGEHAKTGLKREFYKTIKKANAEEEIRLIADLQKIAQVDLKWQALAWILERKYPERWGRKDKISAEVSHTGQVKESNEYNITVEQKVEQTVDKYGSLIDKIVSRRLQNRL
ncbi:hypothetical protein J7E55_01915 [Bacillus sp. ISL-53]|nr:hypothetical protein [Bacillus sp. ISL-53]